MNQQEQLLEMNEEGLEEELTTLFETTKRLELELELVLNFRA
jgi:hypothetical protein